MELNLFELNLNAIVGRNDQVIMGNAKNELDTQMSDDVFYECWKDCGINCIDECRLDVRRVVVKKNFHY